MGLWVLAVAVFFGSVMYGHKQSWDYLLFLNLRFLVALIPVAIAYTGFVVFRRYEQRLLKLPKNLSRNLLITGCGLLFLLLSFESFQFSRNAVADVVQARRMAQMSLSIVWASYALVLLFVGFWRRLQPMRLSALAIFGVTAIKLLIIDMSSLKQLSRILSFVVVGLLMIGASYIYHKVEKRLEQVSEESDS